jgi:hypothetical protein
MTKKPMSNKAKAQRMRAIGKARLTNFTLKDCYLTPDEIEIAKGIKNLMNVLKDKWDDSSKLVMETINNDNIS